MPAVVRTKKQEALWDKAKALVHDKYSDIDDNSDRFWRLVMGIYQKMLGKKVKKSIILLDKSYVAGYQRKTKDGRVIYVAPYITKRAPAKVKPSSGKKRAIVPLPHGPMTGRKGQTPEALAHTLLGRVRSGKLARENVEQHLEHFTAHAEAGRGLARGQGMKDLTAQETHELVGHVRAGLDAAHAEGEERKAKKVAKKERTKLESKATSISPEVQAHIEAVNAFADMKAELNGPTGFGGDTAKQLRSLARDSLDIVRDWEEVEQRPNGDIVLRAPDGSQVLYVAHGRGGERLEPLGEPSSSEKQDTHPEPISDTSPEQRQITDQPQQPTPTNAVYMSVHQHYGTKPWVAQITGTHERYGFDRTFVSASETERSRSGKTSDIGWDLSEPGLYQMGGTKRDDKFVIVWNKDGQFVSTTIDAQRARRLARLLQDDTLFEEARKQSRLQKSIILLDKSHVPGHYRQLHDGRRVYIEPYFTKVVPKQVDARTRKPHTEDLPQGRAKVSADTLAHRLVQHVKDKRMTHEEAHAQLSHLEARAKAGHGMEHGGGHAWKPDEVHTFVAHARERLKAHQAEREADAAQKQPKAKRQAKKAPTPSPAKPETLGNVSRVITPSNAVAKELGRRDIETKFTVREAADLIHSLDTRYPPELQPRLERKPGVIDPATEATVARLVNNPDFESLVESRQASLGAPIIDSRGYSISGTARIEGLKRLYQTGGEHATGYKQFLIDEAERLGLDEKAIAGMKAPVLTRVITSPLTQEQLVAFADEANQRDTQAPGAVSTAMGDAKRLTPDILSLLEIDDEGVADVLSTRNAAFRRAVLSQVIPQAEHGAVVANGQWTTDGAARLRRAIFARAYGNTPALERLGSSEQAERRTLGNALLSAAPAFTRMQAAIESGSAYARPLAPDVVQSVNKLVSLSQQGTSVQHWLDQAALFDEGLTPLAKDLVQVLDTNRFKRSAKATTELLHSYIEGVYALGDPRQAALFSTQTPPSAAAILQQAIARVEAGDAATQTTLFTRRAA